MNAATIKLVVEYQDNCAPSVAYWSGSVLGPDIEHARRIGEVLERRYPGALYALDVYCFECGRWEAHEDALCDFCSDCRCTDETRRARNERGHQLCERHEDEEAQGDKDCNCPYRDCSHTTGVPSQGPI